LILKKKIFSIIKLLFFLSIGALFIWLFVKDLTPEQLTEIFTSFKSAQYGWVALAIFISLISHVIRTLRWQMLLQPLGYNAGFWNVFMSLMIGYFANLALPRLGEVTRCGILAKYEPVPFQKSFGTVVAERAFDVITFIVLFFINFLLQYDLIHQYVTESFYVPLAQKFSFIGKGYILYSSIGVLIILLVIFLLLRKKLNRFSLYRKIVNIIKGFIDGLKSLIKIKRPLLFLFYTILMWFLYFLMTYICFYSIKEIGGVGLMAGFSVLVLGTIGIMIVQGGIGIYPAIVAETLALYGAVSTTAYALGWLIWSAQTITLIIAGITSLIILPLINKKRNGESGITQEKNI
jgi:glycosyltransferase 2 family protein